MGEPWCPHSPESSAHLGSLRLPSHGVSPAWCWNVCARYANVYRLRQVLQHDEAREFKVHLIPAFFIDPARYSMLTSADGIFHVLGVSLDVFTYSDHWAPSVVEWGLAHSSHYKLPKRGGEVPYTEHRSSPHPTHGRAYIYGSCLSLVFHGENLARFYNLFSFSIAPSALRTRFLEQKRRFSHLFILRGCMLSSGFIVVTTGCLSGVGNTCSPTEI
jgi:hypothetical protein